MTHLVLGATGLQGGAVVQHLLKRGASVRALTRNVHSSKSRRLGEQSVDVFQGDLNDPSSLDPAFNGVKGVFSVQDFYAPGVGLSGEIKQGRAVIAAAKRNGVAHVVQSAMGDGNAPSRPGVTPEHFLSKAILERDLRRSGLNYTLLGTVWFMENLLNPEMKPHLMFPVLAGSLKRETRFHMLSVDDLGAMAAEALLEPEKWKNRKINLAGDLMTIPQIKQAYQSVTGQRPKNWRLPSWLFRRFVPEFADQLAWHNEVNFSFEANPISLTGFVPTSFESFLEKHRIVGM